MQLQDQYITKLTPRTEPGQGKGPPERVWRHPTGLHEKQKTGGGKNEETQFIQILIYIVPRIKVPAQCNKCKTLQKITKKKITAGAQAAQTMRISPDRTAVALSGARRRPLLVIFDCIIAEKEGKDKGRGEEDPLRHIHCMIQTESRQPTGTV